MTSCTAAAGTRVLGGASCEKQAAESAQDCNPDETREARLLPELGAPGRSASSAPVLLVGPGAGRKLHPGVSAGGQAKQAGSATAARGSQAILISLMRAGRSGLRSGWTSEPS